MLFFQAEGMCNSRLRIHKFCMCNQNYISVCTLHMVCLAKSCKVYKWHREIRFYSFTILLYQIYSLLTLLWCRISHRKQIRQIRNKRMEFKCCPGRWKYMKIKTYIRNLTFCFKVCKFTINVKTFLCPMFFSNSRNVSFHSKLFKAVKYIPYMTQGYITTQTLFTS